MNTYSITFLNHVTWESNMLSAALFVMQREQRAGQHFLLNFSHQNMVYRISLH
jgi:hypothetical protein